MSGVYSMSGPTYRGATRQEMFEAAMEQPLSITSTLLDQAKGGVLESFGLGTGIREAQLPEEAPVVPGITADPGERDFLKSRRETPQELGARRQSMGAYDEDQYKASPYFRKDIPYDPGMTEQRAAALASMNDAKKVREHYAQKRPISAFIGNLAGQAFDPINYVPVAGPLVKAAAVAKAGRIGGGAIHAGLDAAANTAAFGIATSGERAKFGDDVSWQSTVSQIATAALIGSAFGAIGGAVGRRVDARRVSEAESRLSTLKTTMESRLVLNEGIDAMAHGEDIRLSPNSTEPMARVAGEVRAADAVALPAVETPEFKSWFGDSKVVDDAGKPLVVYHGTGASFDAFDPSVVGQSTDAGKLGLGFYFSARPDIASFYAERSKVSRDAGPNVMPVYLSMKKPLTFDAAEKGDIWTKLRSQSKEWGIELDPVKEAEGNTPNDAWAHAFTAAAKEHGYDGVQLKFPDGGHELVAFEPTQIKSRFNRGAFDKNSPSIIDTTAARPDPLPDGLKQAEASIAKPDDAKALAAQYRVDPQTGSFAEESEVAQLAAEGRLTEEDALTMAQAQSDFETGSAYAEALRSVAACLI